MVSKAELRKIIRQRLLKITAECRAEKSKQLCALLCSEEIVKSANTIALYCSLPDEPDTSYIISALKDRHQLLIPKIVGENMEFYKYSPENIGIGKYGILEPNQGEKVAESEIDLMIMPGVAFTKNGDRLGRGKGYYDRYLSRPNFRAKTLAITFEENIVQKIPTQPHDKKVDRVIYL